MELLHKLYYDAETGFQSKEKLYKKAKEIDQKITLEMVKKFLDEQATSQVTKQVTKNKIYETIVSPSVRNNYQMDIMYLPNPTLNKNYKYLLTCIDVYSRYAFAKPLKNKTGDEIFTAFKEMIKEYGSPKNINVDEGKEFTNKTFQNYCENNDIDLWFSDTQQENKNAIHHFVMTDKIQCWVAGGENIYREALRHNNAVEVHLTHVDMSIDTTLKCEVVYFPMASLVEHGFQETSRRDEGICSFCVYKKSSQKKT